MASFFVLLTVVGKGRISSLIEVRIRGGIADPVLDVGILGAGAADDSKHRSAVLLGPRHVIRSKRVGLVAGLLSVGRRNRRLTHSHSFPRSVGRGAGPHAAGPRDTAMSNAANARCQARF